MPARNHRLPPGRTWPLTRTDVVDGLGPLIEQVRELNFYEVGSGGPGAVVGVGWRIAEGGNYGTGTEPAKVGVYVWVGTMAADDRAAVRAARAALRAEALPRLREWIAGTATAAETWRAGAHRFGFGVEDGRVVVAYDE